MADPALPIEAWANFYVIVGSSAGGLTGLTFVVIALVSGVEVRMSGLRAFVSPTIIHFCSALGISALMNVPGQTASSIGVCLSVFGLLGVIYTGGTLRHLVRTLSSYKAVVEDWLWNVLLPMACYLTLLIAGLVVRAHGAAALYMTAATSLVLLAIGIHNAWDIAVWFTAERPGLRKDPSKKPAPTEPPAE